MAVISFRIDDSLKRKMEKYRHINWSEVVRRAIAEVISEEEMKRREKDVRKLKRAVIRSERLSRRIEGWDSTEEIRRWREGR